MFPKLPTCSKSSTPAWRKAVSGVRTRLLLWYFILTACTALVSIEATKQIYCDDLKAKADASIVKEVDRFKLLQNQNKTKSTKALFDKFLSSYAPTRSEYVITLTNGEIYRASSKLAEELLKQHPNLIQDWNQLTGYKKGQIHSSTERIRYVVQPISLGGERGVFVAIHDASLDYRAGTSAIVLVMQVTLVVLIIFFLLAWVTAGRVLSPLRLLTKAAQSITESDMKQRIPAKGTDEIAELTATFNDMLDRLQFAFDSQQKFLNDASHELRTPITVIQGHLEMLQFQPEKQQETINLVMDELERMNRLVNDLLLLAKTERPDFLRLKPEELDWLTEELYLKAISLANRNWKLESKGLSPIIVDRQRITQAVMNLVQNAVRHTQDGDNITLGSAVKEDYAYIWVRDTGEGIAPADQQRIFQRFVRATNRDKQFEGHGLGLSIVQAVAQAHGGKVELSSRLGHGSTFTIIIPLEPEQNSTTHEPNSLSRKQLPHQLL